MFPSSLAYIFQWWWNPPTSIQNSFKWLAQLWLLATEQHLILFSPLIRHRYDLISLHYLHTVDCFPFPPPSLLQFIQTTAWIIKVFGQLCSLHGNLFPPSGIMGEVLQLKLWSSFKTPPAQLYIYRTSGLPVKGVCTNIQSGTAVTFSL